MAEIVSKLLSVVVALGYLITLAISQGGFEVGVLLMFLYLTLPLPLIWFPEICGSFMGQLGSGHTIDTQSPPFLISFLGWVFLLAPAVYVLFSGQ